MTYTDVFPAEYFPSATSTRVKSLNEAKGFLNDRITQLGTTIDNLLGMADRALDRGDVDAARELFGAAQPYMTERARMTRGQR